MIQTMRGRMIRKILEVLKEGALNQVDFISAVLSSPYGASLGKLEYEISIRHQVREKETHKQKKYFESKKRLQKYFSKLKRDGLIEEIKDKKGYIILSKKGLEKLKDLTNKKSYEEYPKEESENLIIISYDIPEFFKKQRNLVREILKFLGFSMVHKSVWVGKIKIPKEFLINLEKLEVLEYIEFLEVTKTGSLKSVPVK